MYRYSDDLWMEVVSEADLDELARHRNDPSTWQTLTSPLPIQPSKQKDWLKSLGETNFYAIAILNKVRIGLVRITDVDWTNRNAAVGIDIFASHRGRGFGKSVFAMAVAYGFNVLNMHRLWLLVNEQNLAARKIYSNFGFIEEGAMREHIFRDGVYYDYILMGMLRDEYDTAVSSLDG